MKRLWCVLFGHQPEWRLLVYWEDDEQKMTVPELRCGRCKNVGVVKW